MDNSTSAITSPCHYNHLFNAPLCDQQSRVRKIVNVVFHLLFFVGIPLAIYHFIHWCRHWCRSQKIEAPGTSLPAQAIASVQQTKPAVQLNEKLHEETLQFARQKLAEHPEIQGQPFITCQQPTHQPVNPEITLLVGLYWDVFFKALVEAVKKNNADPWQAEEVVKATDDCMKMTYAISVLVLKDLTPFMSQLAQKGDKRLFQEVLLAQDSHIYTTFFYPLDVFHWARGQMIWAKWGSDGFYSRTELEMESIDPKYIELFDTKGTPQNAWVALHNDYCARARLYLDESDQSSGHKQYLMWTEQYTGKNFIVKPTTHPT